MPGDAAGSAVTRWEPRGSSVGLRQAEGETHVVVMIPLAVALKALAVATAAVVGLALCWWQACMACLRPRRAGGDDLAAPAEPAQKQAKAPKKGKKVVCEAGVQGPVHYSGVGQEAGGRYVHECQGFRRAWEITRVVADGQKPHRE